MQTNSHNRTASGMRPAAAQRGSSIPEVRAVLQSSQRIFNWRGVMLR
jgi:hypothetical protein